MSALARWFLAKEWVVSGSDLETSEITKALAKDGVTVKYGHKKSNLPPDLACVVMSNAVKKDNPEYVEAVRRGLRPMTYPQTVGCLSEVYDVIGVSGSHGKSTTTSMVALIMKDLNFDPNVIVGTNLKEFKGRNFRLGKSRWLVLEADEYKRAFTHYDTKIAVVTNIDREHLDYYKDLRDVQRAFMEYLSRVREGGAMVLNKDDRNLFVLKKRIEAFAKKKEIKVFWYSLLNQKEARLLARSLKLSGKHNLSNALAAYTVGVKVLGLSQKQVLASLARFKGSWRRMDYRGRMRVKEKVEVYDDYGHHPTEIKATIQAFREKYPKAKLVCVYEPHQAKRLKMLYQEFIDAFVGVDLLVMLPIYGVAGRDTVPARYTSENLTKLISEKYPRSKVQYLGDKNNFLKSLEGVLREELGSPLPFSVVVMMGAGDIFKLTPEILKK